MGEKGIHCGAETRDIARAVMAGMCPLRGVDERGQGKQCHKEHCSWFCDTHGCVVFCIHDKVNDVDTSVTLGYPTGG